MKPHRAAILCVLLCASEMNASAEAVIEGSLTLPPVEPVSSNPARYQNTTPGEVAPPEMPVAVVYLEGDFSAVPATNTPVPQIVQERFQFSPGVLPVQTGASVEFPNRDDAYHNVFSYSRTKRFDLGRYRKDEKPASVVFDKPGVVKLFCEIHEHMRGTILVLDTPHFTKTGTNGLFRLEHLPAGKFTLKAWINEKTVLQRTVELKDGETLRVDFAGN